MVRDALAPDVFVGFGGDGFSEVMKKPEFQAYSHGITEYQHRIVSCR